MDMYSKYQSPLGYNVGENGIDSYGVDHNKFTLQDEVQYQNLRHNREQEVIKQLNEQGITENYPQYGTNFWGGAENNYGFGDSNIVSAVQNHQSLNTTPIPLNNQQPLTPIPTTPITLNNGFIGGQNFSGNNKLNIFKNQSHSDTGFLLQPDTLTMQGIQYAQNNQAGTLTDANNAKPIDYSLYGEGFSKEFIDKMEGDEEFQKILHEYLIPNEGGYADRLNDRGKKTKYGISQKTYPDEDIKNLTRERANAILYRDFYNWNGLNKLPYPIRGFVVDYGLPTSPLNAIRTVHKVLDLPPNGNIIGSSTMGELENFSDNDYSNFLNNYQKEMHKYYHGLVEKDPTQKENLNGWLNRANGAHLAK